VLAGIRGGHGRATGRGDDALVAAARHAEGGAAGCDGDGADGVDVTFSTGEAAASGGPPDTNREVLGGGEDEALLGVAVHAQHDALRALLVTLRPVSHFLSLSPAENKAALSSA
jgi:hypothetical protein